MKATKNMLILKRVVGALAIGACVFAARTNANTITYATASGATESGGNPVNAQAVFKTGTDSLTIYLTDLQSNPTTVAQLISDLDFTLSSGQTAGTLTSSSGTQRYVNSDGTYTVGSTGPTGWEVDTGTLHLTALGYVGPAGLILGGPDGSDLYSNANSSIAGNGPHNPFLYDTATFTIEIPGLTAKDTVSSATFSFGTTAGNDVVGRRVPDNGTTLLLFGLAMTGLFLVRRRLRVV